MLIAGAGGFANQILGVLEQMDQHSKVVLFDDVTQPQQGFLYNRFPVIHTVEQVRSHFSIAGPEFVLGTGNPASRKMLAEKFIALGGVLKTIVSPQAVVSAIGTVIGDGTAILPGCLVEPGVIIGKGVLLNAAAQITHDCLIGDYSEICPGVILSGRCSVGQQSFVGSGAVILPKIKVGSFAIVAAGAVVTRDVGDYEMVAGIPAVCKKKLPVQGE